MHLVSVQYIYIICIFYLFTCSQDFITVKKVKFKFVHHSSQYRKIFLSFCDDTRPIIFLIFLTFILFFVILLIFVIRVFIIILLEQRRSGSLNNFFPLDNILVVTIFIVAIAAVTATAAIHLLVHFSSYLLKLLEHILLYISSVVLEGSVHLGLD